MKSRSGCLDRLPASYLLAGEEIATMSGDERVIRNERIGFVFQNFNLLARTSGAENVELPSCTQPGLDRRVPPSRRPNAREGQPGRPAGSPSHSVVRRAAAACRHCPHRNDPSILMADEPTGNLDSKTSKDIIQLFRKLNEEAGLTVILVTHDQDIACHASRIIALRDGELVADTLDLAQASRPCTRKIRLTRAGSTTSSRDGLNTLSTAAR